MAESIRSLRDIMEGITEEGKREFTNEEVEALAAAGVDTSNFAKTIDGYRYLGDSAELAAQIGEDITNSFREVRQNFDNIVDQAA
jgi:hypothetical protein